jgi:hypothetical protein
MMQATPSAASSQPRHPVAADTCGISGSNIAGNNEMESNRRIFPKSVVQASRPWESNPLPF